MTDRLSFYQLAATALVFFSFAMAALISRTVFERLPHLEDELAYVYQARIFAHGELVAQTPEPRRAYWQPFVVDYQGNRFGKYSPGWPAFLSIGLNMGQPWVINAFFAALTVALTYRLGREVFNPDTGLIAAALVAFSPMALLLNATLMGHTAALACFTLFMVAYWRMERSMERRRHTLRWGVLAGVALGLLVVNRPLTAIGVTLPFILWSGLKVLRAAHQSYIDAAGFRPIIQTLRPLLALAGIALVISAGLPVFNHAATGDPAKNLYTLVWDYDRVGFGECCGRSGHTIIKGVRHTRFDLSLMAADLFGWQLEPVTEEQQGYLLTSSSYWIGYGLSFFLLPFGLLIGFWAWWLRLWVIGGLLLLITPLQLDMPFVKEDAPMTWAWLGVLAAWMLAPAAVLTPRPQDRANAWTWLLLGVAAGLIGVHLAYWVGSQRYSTRYYFEALSALALLSALPLASLAHHISRTMIYGVVAVILMWSLLTYSLPRIEALYRFNRVSPEMIDVINARRVDDRPVVVLATGEYGTVRWRSFGTLMTLTGPYFKEDIVAAWDYAPNTDEVRSQILERFPDRQVIKMYVRENDYWFEDDQP